MTNGEFLLRVTEWVEEQSEDFTGARAAQMEAWVDRLKQIAEQMLKDEKANAPRPCYECGMFMAHKDGCSVAAGWKLQMDTIKPMTAPVGKIHFYDKVKESEGS